MIAVPAPNRPGLTAGATTWIRRVSSVFLMRMAILLLSLLAVGLYTVNRIVEPASLRGVITAPLVTMRAPIDGQVSHGTAIVGQTIAPGTSLFTVHDPRVDRHRAMELLTRTSASEERIRALDKAIAEMTAMVTELRRRTGDYTMAETARLKATIAGQRAAMNSAQGMFDWAADREAILRKRVSEGIAVEQRLEEAVRARLAAHTALDQAEVELRANLAALDAAGRQIFVQNGFGGAAYTQQKADELDVKLSDMRYQRSVAAADAEGLRAELEAETSRVSAIQNVAVASLPGGVITAVHVAPGAEVTRGAALADVMDCSALYVEASISTGWFATPRPGDPVRVTLYGADTALDGHIRLLRDPGMVLDPSAAPVTVPEGQHTLTVLIDLNDPAAIGRACPIGQPASVRFR